MRPASLFFCALLLASPAGAEDLAAFISPGEPAVIGALHETGQGVNLPGRLSRIGDSISANGGYFLSEASFDKFAAEALKEKAELFRPNFGRRACEGRPNGPAVAKGTENGCAAYSGKTLGWLLTAPAGEASPADMELAEYRPAYAVILIGTNDLGYTGQTVPPEAAAAKLAAY